MLFFQSEATDVSIPFKLKLNRCSNSNSPRSGESFPNITNAKYVYSDLFSSIQKGGKVEWLDRNKIVMNLKEIKVFETAPLGFRAQVEVGACYVEGEMGLLMLQLGGEKPEAGKWGVPAGKVEKGEGVEAGARRELWEETGIRVDGPLESLGALYMHKVEIDYVYHAFRVRVEKVGEIRLSKEHQDYGWFDWDELEWLPLMAGAREALEWYRGKL